MKVSAKEAGRDPSKIELTVSPSAYRFGSTLDLGVVRAFAQIGVTRIIASAFEAGGHEPRDMERYVKRIQDDIIAKL